MLVWASRELGRHPGEGILTGLTICALVAVTATVLLLTQAWTTTATNLIEAGPSLVVRRLEHGTWQPLPIEPARKAAMGVVGVVRATARVWGVVTGPAGAVTILGVTPEQAAQLTELGLTPPAIGEAVLGPGLSETLSGNPRLQLTGTTETTFNIGGRLPRSTSLALHDVILLTPFNARELLGLAPDEASDLAIDVFHEAEEEAILPDLAAAFPFQVRITTKREAVGAAVSLLSRSGGLTVMLIVPALLALTLLIATALRSGSGSRRDIGLYKALGWTTGDLISLHLYKSLAIGLPASALGLALSYTLVFWPGVTWPGAMFLSWQGPPPRLTLDPSGAGLVLLAVAALVLTPWILASVIPSIRGAVTDPDDFMRGGGS